jgi:trans-aconitate methyltransferase
MKTFEFDGESTLHWIKDHKKLITNCFEALKLNGIIRFNFAGKGNSSDFSKVIRDFETFRRIQVFARK